MKPSRRRVLVTDLKQRFGTSQRQTCELLQLSRTIYRYESITRDHRAHWSLQDARRKIEVRREYYNEARPHSALQWMTPADFARQCADRPNRP